LLFKLQNEKRNILKKLYKFSNEDDVVNIQIFNMESDSYIFKCILIQSYWRMYIQRKKYLGLLAKNQFEAKYNLQNALNAMERAV
jgi:hypothetical protein